MRASPLADNALERKLTVLANAGAIVDAHVSKAYSVARTLVEGWEAARCARWSPRSLRSRAAPTRSSRPATRGAAARPGVDLGLPHHRSGDG